jgi:hypothetical protein
VAAGAAARSHTPCGVIVAPGSAATPTIHSIRASGCASQGWALPRLSRDARHAPVHLPRQYSRRPAPGVDSAGPVC